jgi:hypothetical protein
VERPEKKPGYDRTTDFAWISSAASSSLAVRKKFLGRLDDSVRIVLAGELVRLRCKAGRHSSINPSCQPARMDAFQSVIRFFVDFVQL